MNIHHCPDTHNFISSQQNEDVLVVAREVSGKDTVKESKNLILFDAKEKILDLSQTEVGDHDGFWQVPEFDSLHSIESNSAENNTMEVKDSESLNNENSKLINEEMHHLSNKAMNELEVPELVICYKEDSCLDIKDIYIDESMPFCERILFELEVTKEDLQILLLLEKEGSDDLNTEVSAPIPDYSKFCEDQDSKSADSQVVSKDITQAELKVHGVSEDVSISRMTSKDQESATEIVQHITSSEDTQMPLKEPSIEAISVGTALTPADGGGANLSHAKESNNNTLSDLEEKISVDPAEESNCTSDRVDSSDNGNNQITPRVRDSQAGSFTGEHNLGETSFSMTDPVSSLISYSAPFAYSGSLSHRSDSSIASTGSFAFPVLQAEWPSSPVRMVKAGRRHCWKHGGWRQVLLCCRF